jgi:hypothetical protein
LKILLKKLEKYEDKVPNRDAKHGQNNMTMNVRCNA